MVGDNDGSIQGAEPHALVSAANVRRIQKKVKSSRAQLSSKSR